MAHYAAQKNKEATWYKHMLTIPKTCHLDVKKQSLSYAAICGEEEKPCASWQGKRTRLGNTVALRKGRCSLGIGKASVIVTSLRCLASDHSHVVLKKLKPAVWKQFCGQSQELFEFPGFLVHQLRQNQAPLWCLCWCLKQPRVMLSGLQKGKWSREKISEHIIHGKGKHVFWNLFQLYVWICCICTRKCVQWVTECSRKQQ